MWSSTFTLKITKTRRKGNIDDCMEMYWNVWTAWGSSTMGMWQFVTVSRDLDFGEQYFSSESRNLITHWHGVVYQKKAFHGYTTTKKVHIYVKVWRLVHLVDCKFRSRNFHRISVTGKIAIWLYLVLKIFFFPVPQTKCSLLPEKYRGYIPGYRRVGYSIWPLISIECQACRFDNTSKWVNEGNF